MTVKEIILGQPLTYFFQVPITGNLGKDVVNFIQLKEGYADDDLSDTASADPVPGTHTLNIPGKGQKTSSHWHTRMGITWKTFKTYAPKFGYAATPENFFQMPDDLWLKIYREIYYRPFAGLTSSELINYYVSLWAWGSGIGGAKKLLQRLGQNLNEYLQKYGELATLELLIETRIKRYEEIAQNNPNNAKYLQGWKNGALSFYKNFSGYATGMVQKKKP